MNHRRRLALAAVSCAFLAALTACGSGSGGGTKTPPSTPVFTSTPVTAATQDVAYTYQLAATDPAGGAVAFTLTTSPNGAALSGSTVNWTPTAAESRVSNSFTATATSASGGTATQSWTVTPGGTITVNWVNTYWTANGPVQVAALASQAASLSAVVTNPDGSITVQKAAATSPGVFSILNVPSGYYWLEIGTAEGFWTNTSTFDAGSDIAGGPLPTLPTIQNTTFNFTLTGLDSVPEFTPVDFLVPLAGLPGFTLIDNVSSTTLSATGGIESDIDWSQIDTAFLFQYVPATLGSLMVQIIDPSSTASFSLVNGAANPITETLQPSPTASINLNIPGASQWAPLFTGIGPSDSEPFASALVITAQPYVTGRLASGTTPFSSSLGVAATTLSVAGTSVPGFFPSIALGCGLSNFPVSTPTPAQAAITTDQNFGAFVYGDPFPSGWAHTLSLCQEYTVAVPVPGTSSLATFYLVDSATVAPGTTPLAPIVGPVQSPSVNGTSLYTASTLNSTVVPLSWSAPAGAAPFGYTVRVFIQTAIEGNQTYAQTGAAFSTSGTSISLPPLAAGNTYVFSITADADGSANIQTGPFRSSLPAGYATVISAPVTISSEATTPAIHGDRRVIARFSRPLSQIGPQK